jgi:hypothetical protein
MLEDQPKSGKEFEQLVTRIYQRLHEKAVITPNDKIRDIDSNQLRQSVVDVTQENVNALIFTTEQGEPKASVPQIVNWIINKNIENIFRDVQVGILKRKRILVNFKNKSSLFFRDAAGGLRKLECLCLEADFWIEARKIPLHLSKYCNAETGKALAEIASTSIEICGEPHKFEIIAKLSEEHGSQVSMRLHKQDQKS